MVNERNCPLEHQTLEFCAQLIQCFLLRLIVVLITIGRRLHHFLKAAGCNLGLNNFTGCQCNKHFRIDLNIGSFLIEGIILRRIQEVLNAQSYSRLDTELISIIVTDNGITTIDPQLIAECISLLQGVLDSIVTAEFSLIANTVLCRCQAHLGNTYIEAVEGVCAILPCYGQITINTTNLFRGALGMLDDLTAINDGSGQHTYIFAIIGQSGGIHAVQSTGDSQSCQIKTIQIDPCSAGQYIVGLHICEKLYIAIGRGIHSIFQSCILCNQILALVDSSNLNRGVLS